MKGGHWGLRFQKSAKKFFSPDQNHKLLTEVWDSPN